MRALAVRLAVGGWRWWWWGGGAADQDCWTFLNVCFFVRAAVTPQSRPTFFMFQTGDGCDESPPASLAVCFVVFFRTRKERTCQILLAFFVRFRHCAPVVVGFFFFDGGRTLCSKRRRSVKAARSPLLCHTPQPRLTFKGPTNSLYFSFMCQKKKKKTSLKLERDVTTKQRVRSQSRDTFLRATWKLYFHNKKQRKKKPPRDNT